MPETPTPAPAEPAPHRRCVHCGYDLRGSPQGVCPECGAVITEFSESPIPWVHRRAIGRWRAGWRTVWVACIRPRTLVQAAAALPVDFKDAQRFRRTVITWVWLTTLVPIAAIYVTIVLHGGIAMPSFDPSFSSQRWLTLMWLLGCGYFLPPVVAGGLLISLVLGTTAAGFFARPREAPVSVRNQSVAMMRYTVGPLALLPAALLPLGVCACLMIGDPVNFPWLVFYLCLGFGGLMLLGSLGSYVVSTLRVSAALLHRGLGRILLTLGGLLFLWLGAIVLGLGLFPMLVGYGWVALASLL